MSVRALMLFLMVSGVGVGRAETPVTGRLRAEMKGIYAYAPLATAESERESDGDPVLELEPMVIKRALAEPDALAEARRAAEAREAAKFSALKGGTLIAFKHGELGFWPKIVPVDATPVKKADVALTIDLLRIKW